MRGSCTHFTVTRSDTGTFMMRSRIGKKVRAAGVRGVCAKGSRLGRSSPECKLGVSLAARGIQIHPINALHPHAQQRDAPKVPWAKLIRGTRPKERHTVEQGQRWTWTQRR